MSDSDDGKPDGGGGGSLGDFDLARLKPEDVAPLIPGYKIEKLINSGAMGHVFLAIQEALERPVAIKVIMPALSVDPTFRQRFLKEGKIIAQLRHPHILTIHDIGECLNQYYMIMEYVRGGTLRDQIQIGLSPERAVTILRQVASALGHAHHQGFVHRDIKPANILFRDDDDAVLSDFGIAKGIEESVHLTATGLAVGTVLYMSPEQAQGKPLDGRSDLYSLGLVFFEMLAGFRPDRTLGGYTESLPPQLSRYQRILDGLLARDPSQRFADAGQLLEALDRLDQSPEDVTPTMAVPVRDERPPARRRWPKFPAVAAALLAALLAAGGGYLIWSRQAKPALAVQVSYAYQPIDQLNFRPLLNESVLHSGDRYQIRLLPLQDSYVYIFQIDGSGAVYRLFPPEAGENSPAGDGQMLRAGATYVAPAADEAFHLDEQIGREQLHVLAFRERDFGLENQYATLVEARRAQDQARVAELHLRLSERLRQSRADTVSVLNFKHNARGSHEL